MVMRMRWNFLTVSLLVSALFWVFCIGTLLLSEPGYLARPWGVFWLVVFPVAQTGFFLAGLALVLGRGMFLGVGEALDRAVGLFTPFPGAVRLLALALGLLCLMLGAAGTGSAGAVFMVWSVRAEIVCWRAGRRGSGGSGAADLAEELKG